MFALSFTAAVVALHCGDANAQQVRVRARAVLRNDLVELRQPEPRKPGSGSSFAAAAATRIEQMQTVCKLTPGQSRTLTLAAKGVEHRVRRAARKTEIQLLGDGWIVDRPAPNYVKQLSRHSIWVKAVGRVLTKQQQATWAEHLRKSPRQLNRRHGPVL